MSTAIPSNHQQIYPKLLLDLITAAKEKDMCFYEEGCLMPDNLSRQFANRKAAKSIHEFFEDNEIDLEENTIDIKIIMAKFQELSNIRKSAILLISFDWALHIIFDEGAELSEEQLAKKYDYVMMYQSGSLTLMEVIYLLNINMSNNNNYASS